MTISETKTVNDQSVAYSSIVPEAAENLNLESTINLDRGDPTMYEKFWKQVVDVKISIDCSESMSYFVNPNHVCWYAVPKLEEEIRTLHKVVGNAVVEDRHILIGTGSSQLIQAALYALSITANHSKPIATVAAAPYYSSYREQANMFQSRLFEWGGDAYGFDKDDEPYIEMVTSPNNPDGLHRRPVVNRPKGMVVYDLAYYWPQYAAITSCLDHDIMLFTLSKLTGHAGSRIGWAIVKDEEVAKKMVKLMADTTIGVSKEAQMRATSLLHITSRSYQVPKTHDFYESSRLFLGDRWRRLRDALAKHEDLLRCPDLPQQKCFFAKKFVETYPAFAWLRGKDGVDCVKLLNEHKVLARGGVDFGCGAEFARISMVAKDEEFDEFLKRVPAILKGLLAATPNNK